MREHHTETIVYVNNGRWTALG